MLANEMKFSFMLKFDSMFEFATPAYDDRQIGWLLTTAQNRVFLDKYYTPSNKFQRGFEADEKRRRDLEQLIKQDEWVSTTPTPGPPKLSKSASQVGIHPNGAFFDLPTGFLYAIEEAVVTDALAAKEVTVRPVTHDQYMSNINNPFKRPYSNLVWRMDYSRQTDAAGDLEGQAPSGTFATPKRTELITDGSTVTKYRLRYLRLPPEIVVDEFDLTNQAHCILDETLHESIVDEAVKIAKAAVKPQDYQITQAEKADSEN